jgi:hypothetical protein
MTSEATPKRSIVWPPSMAVTAGALPLKGMWLSFRPFAVANISAARCCVVPTAIGSIGHLAGAAARQLGELTGRLRRNRGMHHEDVRHRRQQDDRFEVAHRVVRELGVQAGKIDIAPMPLKRSV